MDKWTVSVMTYVSLLYLVDVPAWFGGAGMGDLRPA
jgi:hypothetical protein